MTDSESNWTQRAACQHKAWLWLRPSSGFCVNETSVRVIQLQCVSNLILFFFPCLLNKTYCSWTSNSDGQEDRIQATVASSSFSTSFSFTLQGQCLFGPKCFAYSMSVESSSLMNFWHFARRTLMASETSTSGGRIPVDSTETAHGNKGQKKKKTDILKHPEWSIIL